MPPLAFTHLKNAAADRGAELKSMPPLAVVSARILIGVPLAAFPLPIPHLRAEDDVSSLPTSLSPLSPDEPPHAASPSMSPAAAIGASRRLLVLFNTLCLLRVLRRMDVGKRHGSDRHRDGGWSRRTAVERGEGVVALGAQEPVQMASPDAEVAAVQQRVGGGVGQQLSEGQMRRAGLGAHHAHGVQTACTAVSEAKTFDATASSLARSPVRSTSAHARQVSDLIAS